MNFGVLGTGMVGATLATKLVSLGHDVMMGSRTSGNDKARAWQLRMAGRGRIGTFGEAARHGELLLNCTQGAVSLDVLRSIDRADLAGKVLIDVANPLDFSRGLPPALTISNTDSLGESIQRALPGTHVVKALNTCNSEVMVDPDRVPGEHDIFICGNSADAKATVRTLLEEFGWRSIIDLGDITRARGTEQMLPVWVSLYQLFGSPRFNFRIVRAPEAGG
jgi:predicted dinucleotide-binding enzyme